MHTVLQPHSRSTCLSFPSQQRGRHSVCSKKYDRSCYAVICHALFVLTLLLVVSEICFAQSIIRRKGNPENWNRADYPMPFGLIAVTGYTVPLYTYSAWRREQKSVEYKSGEGTKAHLDVLPFELSVYCDAWQLGYHNRPYGNVISFCYRSIGDDQFAGSFIEYGSTPKVTGSYESQNGFPIPITQKSPISFTPVSVVAIGKRGRFKSDNANTFSMIEVSAAYYHYLPLTFGNIYSNLCFNVEYGYGYRVPSGNFPAYIGIVAFFSSNATRLSDGFTIRRLSDTWSTPHTEWLNDGSSSIIFGVRAYLSLNWNAEY